MGKLMRLEIPEGSVWQLVGVEDSDEYIKYDLLVPRTKTNIECTGPECSLCRFLDEG